MIRYGRTTVLLTQRTTENLKFSNTMEWRTYINGKRVPEILKKVDPNVLDQLHLPAPPRNDSVTTSTEIHELLLKKKERNKQNQDDIENEKDGNYIVRLFVEEEDKNMLVELNEFITPYIFYFKKKFDRVRPRILEPQIEPTIDPPGHPAYPSGHATQVYSFALYMAHRFPHNKEEFMRIADRVATNRELAGVHYSSDTRAGHQLARQLVPIFVEFSRSH